MAQSPECPRNCADCSPLQNVISDDLKEDGQPASFVCVGYNDPSGRSVEGDRFTMCWKNDEVDERGHWDRRDMLDTIACMTTALSIDENIRVGNGMTEDDMNQFDHNAAMRGES